jgi:hypothetical protein
MQYIDAVIRCGTDERFKSLVEANKKAFQEGLQSDLVEAAFHLALMQHDMSKAEHILKVADCGDEN